MSEILLSKEKITEISKQLKMLQQSMQNDNEEGNRMGGPMDSFKEAAAFQTMTAAKKEKIEELQSILDTAKELPDYIESDMAILGKWIIINNGREEKRYRLVHSLEAEPVKNLLSIDSPLGKELVGKKSGESIVFNSQTIKIVNIE